MTFEPGARTAWHTHPLGQTLIVTSGCGWTQCWGEPKEEIRPGDVVWCPPGKKHWHGATATTAMSHIAIVEKLNGKAVDWMEKVSDEQYQAELTASEIRKESPMNTWTREELDKVGAAEELALAPLNATAHRESR